MACNTTDDFENDWTFVDREGKVDIEVRKLCRATIFFHFVCCVCSGFTRALNNIQGQSSLNFIFITVNK